MKKRPLSADDFARRSAPYLHSPPQRPGGNFVKLENDPRRRRRDPSIKYPARVAALAKSSTAL